MTMMMMIAFITIKSSLVHLIEGLCAQIYFSVIILQQHMTTIRQHAITIRQH